MVRIPLLFCKENGRTNRRLLGNKLLPTMGYWTLVCEFVYVAAVVVHCHRRRRCRSEFGFVFLLFYYSIVTAGIVFCARTVPCGKGLRGIREVVSKHPHPPPLESQMEKVYFAVHKYPRRIYSNPWNLGYRNCIEGNKYEWLISFFFLL